MMRVHVDPNAKLVRLGGRPPKLTTIFLAIHATTFLLLAFADVPKTWLAHLAVTAQGLFSGEVWQPLTALWLHVDVRGALTDMLSMWIFGSALERWWGPKRFFLFVVVTSVAALVVGALAALPWPLVMLSGTEGASMGMLVAMLVIFPQHLIHLYRLTPLKVKVSCLMLGGFTLLGTLVSRHWIDRVMQLTGMAVALAFLSPRRMINEWRAKRMKSKLHVIHGGKKADDDPKYLN
jgi:membrane associated rhomboid family serine protease